MKIIKENGKCNKECSLLNIRGPKPICSMFNVEIKDFNSLVICNKVYGLSYKGRI